MSGRLNRLADTVTDTGEAIVNKGGAATISVLTMVDDVAAAGAHWTGGFRARVKADVANNAQILSDERQQANIERVEAHRIRVETYQSRLAAAANAE